MRENSVTDSPGQAAAPDYDCAGLPEHQLPDFDLLAFYRQRFGDEIVNEQIATLGTDRVIETMQRAHRSHLVARDLSEKELHQRAELVESLMLEFGVPALGEAPDTQTDLERMQMFVRVVKGLADTVAEFRSREEAMRYPSYDDVAVEPGEANADDDEDYITDVDDRPF